MINTNHLIRALCAVLMLGVMGARAEEAPYRRDISVSVRVLSPELIEQTYSDRITIMSEAAIGSLSQIPLSLNEHFYEWRSIEAATLKPDGRRIAVTPEQILSSTGPNAAQMGVFHADMRVRTIVFPNVEVGDVLTYSRTVRGVKPVVPGGFDDVFSIPPHAYYGDVRIDLDAPADMRLAVRRDGFSEDVKDVGSRRLYIWTLPAQPRIAAEPNSVSYFDYSPYVAFSNRESDDAVGRYFRSVAEDKAAVTPDISKLADELTRHTSDRREQARAIFDHVSTKIRYFHILIGQGGWTPHPASTVLANGFGDCKDHVTLMRALLSSKGIASDYVLLQAGAPTYRAWDLPVARYDHVILYLPEFDLYVDPTNSLTAFGVVSFNVAGKHVLHIRADSVEKRVAPAPRATDETVAIQAVIRVAEDGRYSGTSSWRTRANQASVVRRQIVQSGLKSRAEFMGDLLRRTNMQGKGSIEVGRASDHTEPFKAEMAFDVENRLMPSASSNPPVPYGPFLIESPHLYFLRYQNTGRRLDTVCPAQTYELDVEIILHDKLEFGPHPLPVEIETEYGSFRATYRVEGKRLRVKRSWRLQPPGMTCDGAVVRTKIMPLVNAMTRDIGARLFVRRVADARN